MNKNQLIVLWVGIIVVVLMGLYPPWQYNGHIVERNVNVVVPAGYSFIGDPIYSAGIMEFGASIDVTRLLIQWFMVAFITGGLIYTLKEEKAKNPKDEEKNE